MDQPIYSSAGDVAYLEGNAAVISFSKSVATKTATGEVPTTPIVKNFEGISGTGKVAPWGDDNLFPQHVYPVSYPTPEKTYYQLAHWNAIRKSGWLDVATAIPEFKKSLMKNSLNINQ